MHEYYAGCLIQIQFYHSIHSTSQKVRFRRKTMIKIRLLFNNQKTRAILANAVQKMLKSTSVEVRKICYK